MDDSDNSDDNSNNDKPLLVDDAPGDGERIVEVLDQDGTNDDHGRIPTEMSQLTS